MNCASKGLQIEQNSIEEVAKNCGIMRSPSIWPGWWLIYLHTWKHTCIHSYIFVYCKLAVCFDGLLLRLNICMTVFLVVSG